MTFHKSRQIINRTKLILAAVTCLSLLLFLDLQPNLAQELVSQTILPSEISVIKWDTTKTRLAVVAGNIVYILNSNLEIETDFEAHSSVVSSVSWNQNGTFLATSGSQQDKIIKVWSYDQSLNSVQLVRTLTSPPDNNIGLSFDYPLLLSWSPDGSKFAEVWATTEQRDNENLYAKVFLRDTLTWNILPIGPFASYNPGDLLWSSDSSRLFYLNKVDSIGHILSVYLADVNQNYVISTTSPIDSFAVDDNKLILTSAGDISTYLIVNGQESSKHDFGILGFDSAFNEAGDKLAIIYGPDIHLFDTTNQVILNTFRVGGVFLFIEWHPNTNTLLIGGDGGKIQLWDISDLLTNPPSASAGADRTVTASNSLTATITLDASASTDPDGTITTFEWTENGQTIATGATPTVNLSVGTHTITLTVTDDDGLTASDTVQITVKGR